MKRIIILLLIFGLTIAAPFPQSVYGSTMELVDYQGDTIEGEAYYSNYDESILGSVTTSPMSYAEFIDYPYTQQGWTQTNEPGVGCYYICDSGSDSYGAFSYCYMDCHKDNAYYMIDTAVYGGTEYDALYEDLVLAKAVFGTNQGNNNGNNGNDGGDGGTGNDGGDGGTGDDGGTGELPFDPNKCCSGSLSLIVLGLSLIGFAYRN